ncbi:L-ascorbate metabolism protein UlaG (beta-lactamase superfamily) [Sphingomonas naasensis]|uniref:Zn-dependent hydrolase n=1 Tax=Sphingomonas naasensis TaxID=1344951 RepID=A0A4S1W5N1_9SPHN|nr:MBL fold metallo-hydrolase [Sphingomonas naasensis]NIJ19962.1 L-ascorbate metabolism protein UlaG (beta-lactamase superfamily) [Sphingomonas naasensis]TGX37918.1 Zn-dependent hydrolase [Sphingomonas naasensis]
MRLLKPALAGLLWIVVVLCLAITILPHFLDRIYYRGPASAHFDGAHFFNPDGDDDRLAAGPSPTRLIAQRLFGDSTQPVWPADVAVQPSKPPARVEGAAMRVTWIGHATVLVQADGINILTDPVWSERAGPFGFGPSRVAAPGVRFEDLPRIDLVLVSHNHYDHMDLATLERLRDRDHPQIVTSLGNDAVIGSVGVRSVALDWGQTVLDGATRAEDPHALHECVRGCRRYAVTVTRNHHWDSRWFADRNRALWSSFVVQLPHGNVFFAGDTGLGDGKWPAEAAALGPIRFAAIPIGAFRFEEGQMASGSHIGPQGALAVWDGLGRPFALPIHWGTFRLSREARDTPPKMLDAMLRCAGSDPARFAPVAIGVPIDVPPLGAAPPRPDMARVEQCVRAGRFARLR